jgi:transcriptional regulator with XRE-family HTH domain
MERQDDATPQHPGDLGRRVAYRREELGLSREDLARLAGTDPGYVSYLEEVAVAQPTMATLLRLAAALKISPEELLGGAASRPPGRGRAGSRTALVELGPEESAALVAPGGIGRLVFVDPSRGPVALPMNFRVSGSDILLRTGPETGAALHAALLPGATASFEVDRIDDAMSEGWSVLVTGTLELATDGGAEAPAVEPWAGGERDVLLRLVARETTGRRITNSP